jgi:hypothetical protein
MVYATYHSTADGLNLREQYYTDRRATFPPDHGKQRHFRSSYQEPLTGANVERNPDQNYEVGWKRYGFAAPFSKKATVYPLAQVEREDVKVV